MGLKRETTGTHDSHCAETRTCVCGLALCVLGGVAVAEDAGVQPAPAEPVASAITAPATVSLVERDARLERDVADTPSGRGAFFAGAAPSLWRKCWR